MHQPNIAIVFGSYRPQANGRRLVHLLDQSAKEIGIKTTRVDAAEENIPFLTDLYDKLEAPPKALQHVQRTFSEVDGFIFVTGEYNHLPQAGILNLLNFFSKEYKGKFAALATYSIGAYGGIRAAGALREVASALGMLVLPSALTVKNIEQSITQEGTSLTEQMTTSTRRFCQNIVAFQANKK